MLLRTCSLVFCCGALLIRAVMFLLIHAADLVKAPEDDKFSLYIRISSHDYQNSLVGPARIRAELTSGKYFGELALLAGNQKDAGLRNASIVAGAKGCGCLVLAKNDFDQYIADKVRLAGARQRRRAADKVRTRLLAKHIDSSVKLLLTAHQQMLTERLTRFDLNGEGLVTASELLGVIFECGLDLENKEELELQALLLGDDEDSSVEAEDQLIISEFFEGIGGRALKDLDGEEPEDEDAELMKTPTWAAAKEQYEAATKARAAFREMVVAAAPGMPSATWAVRWRQQQQQLTPALRNAAWAPGRERFPQWKDELATAKSEKIRAAELVGIEGKKAQEGKRSPPARGGRVRLNTAFADLIINDIVER